MKLIGTSLGNTCLSFTLVGVMGVTGLLWPVEEPEKAVRSFAELFTSQNAEGIMKVMLPEMVGAKELRTEDVQGFLKRYRSKELRLDSLTVDRKMKAEDGSAERFQSTLTFRGPVLGPRYPEPCSLKMTLLWVLAERRWLMERPLSVVYSVSSNATFPTREQEEVAMEFDAALTVLKRIGLQGTEDLALIGQRTEALTDELKELERLHPKEKGKEGIHRTAYGVQVLLKASGKKSGGLLKVYHGDFKSGTNDKRRTVSWEIFADYVEGALKEARNCEEKGNAKGAERIYRQIIAFGRLFLDEPGGIRFLQWGMLFQKTGADELARLFEITKNPEQQKVVAFARLCGRRLDLLQTAFSCLDDLSDFRSLKAAMVAARNTDEMLFRPWAINTLTILALKGAPASQEAIESMQGMVYVVSPAMQKTAASALEELAAEPGGKAKDFVAYQRAWVGNHQVYGTAPVVR